MTKYSDYKSLFNMTIDNVVTSVQADVSRKTGNVAIRSWFHKGSKGKIRFKPNGGKQIQLDLPDIEPGMIRHHVAYDFKRPEAFVVVISRSLHLAIHNPRGYEGGRLCIE